MFKFLPGVYYSLLTAAILVGLSIGANKSTSAESQFLFESDRNSGPNFIFNRRTIAVIGQGQAISSADIARLEFRFSNRTPPEQPGQETPSLPGEEILKPVMDALMAIEIPGDNIEIQTTSPENPKLLVKIDKPNRDRVQSAVKAVNAALKDSNSLFIQGIGAEYAVKDCQPLETAARRAALGDAQYQVKSIASEMGVKLGEILFVTVYPIVTPASVASCGSKVAVSISSFFTNSESIPPYNPSDLPEVKVRSQIGVTYAIEQMDDG